jgi:hypothetical protein
LINSVKILKKNGVLAVVTFHSLEDKIVKYFFKSLSENKSVSRYEPKVDQKELFFSMPQKKPITPTDQEISENHPSRSAKLRYVIKNKETYEIETDILDKFSNLIEIENLGSILMTKLLIFGLMLSLIISTSLIKTSTRNLDEQIYSIQENLLFLEDRLKDSKLEFDY